MLELIFVEFRQNDKGGMETYHFTKSKFLPAIERPTKLYYIDKYYSNQKVNDSFLEALTQHGFQVWALLKYYYRDDLDFQLLEKENVTIFEAAIQFQNFLVRVDILIKNKDSIQFIEVKSK